MGLVLGIETSCDDTGVAIVENGRRVVFDQTIRQTELHKKFGGVVPEVASREHLISLFSLLQTVWPKTKLSPKKLDLVAVTVGPGLRGSLLVGLKTAQTLAWLWGKKIVPVNHLQAHLFASLLESKIRWRFPLLGMVVSGGHTSLVLVKAYDQFRLLGETRDDAAGEAFDKIAQLLNLGYPGGPVVEKMAAATKSQPKPFLPRPMSESPDLDFSFAGLKTAVKYALPKYSRKILAKEAQEAITDSLVEKLVLAYQKFKPEQIVLGGGVMANRRLREKIQARLAGQARILLPALRYTLDNAAMIAGAAYFLRERATSWYNLEVKSDLPFNRSQ